MPTQKSLKQYCQDTLPPGSLCILIAGGSPGGGPGGNNPVGLTAPGVICSPITGAPPGPLYIIGLINP